MIRGIGRAIATSFANTIPAALVLLSTSRERVELPDAEEFTAWVERRYPSNRYRVELEREPFQWITPDRE